MAPEVLATHLYIGRVISTARQRKGWKQTELAEAAGLAVTMVMDIETGRAGLTAQRRKALVQALSLKPGALDAPGFVLLSPDEQQLIIKHRRSTAPRFCTRLLSGRLAARSPEPAPC